MTLTTPLFIIVAEDDSEDFEFLCVAIDEISGKIQVKRAGNGDVLMELLEAEIPDLLFLDLVMPCKDGRQCIREIRANSRYDNLPVIIYTSLDHVEIMDYCFEDGANHYAVKPFTYSELKVLLDKILKIDWKNARHIRKRSEFLISA